MKNNEIITIELGRDDAVVLTECGEVPPYRSGKIPRLVILTGSYSDESAVFPAQSVTLYGGNVRKLYDGLKKYYEEDEKITALRNEVGIQSNQ